MMGKHTPEPWTQDAYYVVAEVPTGRPGGEVIGHLCPTVARLRSKVPNIANCQRSVAAVNACAGIPTEALEADVVRRMRGALEDGAQLNTPDFLDWIAARLVKVHGESPYVDYVATLKERAETMRAILKEITNDQAD